MPQKRKPHPSTAMLELGFDPALSVGSLELPIYLSSTYVFPSAKEGEAFFAVACGLREGTEHEKEGLIYGRLKHPGAQISEKRLAVWDGAEDCVTFPSGMAAILATFLAYLHPGDVVLHTEPVYGGTDHLLKSKLREFGIHAVPFSPGDDLSHVISVGPVRMIFIETPANPTNKLYDIRHCAEIARMFSEFPGGERVLVVVDNTFLGPIGQHPLEHGADLVIYSLTKNIGGHSDLIAGACLGSLKALKPIREMRGFIGPMDAFTAFLVLRSLEDMQERVKKQVKNAVRVARFLSTHAKISRVNYLGLLKEGDPQYAIYRKQCLTPGSMVSFDIRGGKDEAFRFLDSLQFVKRAVSLGSTKSLAQHPYSMTQAGVDPREKEAMEITDSTIRLSVGVGDVRDIIADLRSALKCV